MTTPHAAGRPPDVPPDLYAAAVLTNEWEDSELGIANLRDRIAAALAAARRDGEAIGYERGRRDFQFRPEGDNHHNAALCPYCSPREEGGQ